MSHTCLLLMVLGSFNVVFGAGIFKKHRKSHTHEPKEFKAGLSVMPEIVKGKEKIKHMPEEFFEFFDAKRETPLLWIMKKTQNPRTKELLQNWIDARGLKDTPTVNFVDEKGNSALDLAINRQDTKLISLLLKFPGIELKYDTLMRLIERGSDFIFGMLVGPDHEYLINRLTEDKSLSPLLLAARGGNWKIIGLLIRYGAIVDIENKDGATPLFMAKNLDTIKLLLDDKANIKHCDKSGRNRFMKAVMGGDLQTVKYLTEHKADIHALDNSNKNALSHAIETGPDNMVDYLVSIGVKVLVGNQKRWLEIKSGRSVYTDGNSRVIEKIMGFVKAKKLELCHVPKFFFNYFYKDVLLKDVNPLIWLVLNSDNSSYLKLIPEWVEASRKLKVEPNIEHAIKIADKKGKVKAKEQLMLCRELSVKSYFTAIEEKFLPYIEKGIGEISIKSRNNQGETVLAVAAKTGQLDLVKKCVELGAEVDSSNNSGQTPLMLAVKNGHLDVTEYLVEKTKMINSVDKNGQSALHMAAANCSNEIVVLLLAKGARVNDRDEKGYTPLIIAIKSQHNDYIVETLLKSNVDLEKTYDNGRTPLHFAAERGVLSIIGLLLNRNISPNAVDNNGVNALMLAAKNGRLAAAERLLQDTDDIDSVDKSGWTALHHAAAANESQVVQFLLSENASLDIKDEKEQNAISLAINKGHGQVFGLFAKPNLKGNIRSDCWKKVIKVRVAQVRRGLKIKESVNTNGEHGVPPLMHAVEKGDLELVQRILQAKADVNASDDNSVTPIMMAARSGDKEIVKELLRYSADLSATDVNNRGVLWYANFNIRGMLINAMDFSARQESCQVCNELIGDEFLLLWCNHRVHVLCLKNGFDKKCSLCSKNK